MKVASKSSAELNEPVAVVELSSKNSSDNSEEGHNNVIRFDMNREQMSGLLKTLESVQRKIDDIGS